MQSFVKPRSVVSASILSVVTLACAAGGGLAADFSPSLNLSAAGSPVAAFVAGRDGCDGHDVPDAPLRAFRDSHGRTVAFGLHFVNRRLRGPAIDALKIECKIVLNSGHKANPAHYDDYNWITATWTDDGNTIAALIHHEFHGNEHAGKCLFKTMMQCWMNTITFWRSQDAGSSFQRSTKGFVVAAAPFGQGEQQGRHRGFFNPSNIVASGRYKYFMASQTGWEGQPHGVCLFRSADPHKQDSWRAWDGKTFSIRYIDPYSGGRRSAFPRACKPIAPFPAPVGAIVRHRSSGHWLAVFQARADSRYFPLPGIYYATGTSLTHWSTPRLLIAGKTLYDDPCKSGGRIISYPSIMDAGAKGRNYDDVGGNAFLFYASMKVKGCSITSSRDLIRLPVRITQSK
ncbi:MAG: hypothetical protein NWT00_10490 [Beijerinckiaceae bacterium]|jgi:hypothetical protein|nr:hypothetical protein [Beijerinckiaceae bacterium]